MSDWHEPRLTPVCKDIREIIESLPFGTTERLMLAEAVYWMERADFHIGKRLRRAA